MRVGSTESRGGFFTKALYLRGIDTSELEDRIGYRRGRLAKGWYLLFLAEMPTEADFEFRGYSQTSGGVSQGHLPQPPDPRTAEQKLKDDGYRLPHMKKKVVDEVFRLDGPERLAKVNPVALAFGANDYPAGKGIPQWEMMKRKPFLVKAFIAPGQKWLGDYSDNAN